MGYKITQLTALGGNPSANDIIPVVDVSDTTQASSGSTKKMTVTELANSIGVGDTGPKGDTGVKGDTGNTGSTGAKGDTGTSAVGIDSLVINQVPSGSINGSNTVFTTASSYVGGSIQVFRDGQLMRGGGEDYTETNSTTITFTSAPATGSVILVTYQMASVGTGNSDTLDGYHANATPTANQIPVLDSNAKMPISTVNPIHPINAPEGFLINGKIVPSVSSNNLTVALKTLAGTDPSSSDPIYVKIGDTVRTISSALSVDAGAGTNWLLAGSNETAGKEIDFFVYLGVKTSDSSIKLGFSRIPYATNGSDFATTGSSERYCRMTSAEYPGDFGPFVNIGRFAATLSGALNWTVPTYTSANLIQRPIYDSRWLVWTPTITPGGNLTISVDSTTKSIYKFSENELLLEYSALLTYGGTLNSGLLEFSLPATPKYIRSAFNGDAQNSLARCTQADGTKSLVLITYNGTNYGSGTFHTSFNGTVAI